MVVITRTPETPEKQIERLTKLYDISRKADAVRFLKTKLKLIEEGMASCILPNGCMRQYSSQKWGILIDKQSAFNEVIEYLEFNQGGLE